MPVNPYKVNWSDTAKSDLRDIHNFIKEKSVQGAKNVVLDIRNASKSLRFSEQTQIEEYMPICGRIVVRNYKILYTFDEANNTLNVVRVFDTRQDPSSMTK